MGRLSSCKIKILGLGHYRIFEDEKHHEKAKKILHSIAEGKIRGAVFSDYVLDELLTLVRKKKSPAASNEVLEQILGSEIRLAKISENHLVLAYEVFRKYPALSFTDATSVASMLDSGIREIYSFDRDFDTVPKITRLEVG